MNKINQANEPEPWLRGTLTEVPAVTRAVLHVLQLTNEDLHRWAGELTDGELNQRPSGLASVAFHVRHIAGSLDRLLTYAEGHQLSSEQIAFLKSELEAHSKRESLLRIWQARSSEVRYELAFWLIQTLRKNVKSAAKNCRRHWAACWFTLPITLIDMSAKPLPRPKLFWPIATNKRGPTSVKK